MIEIVSHRDGAQNSWQDGFLEMLPEIEQRLRSAFRKLKPESLDDATENGIVHCLLAYKRLAEKGRLQSASPSTLVWYATLQFRSGRRAGCRMNSREPLSRYAQLMNGIQVEPLQSSRMADGQWIADLVEDRRSPVVDQVIARMDLRDWFATLSRRTSRIAKDLAYGFTTAEVASKHQVSASRISQIRRALKLSWIDFQTEADRIAL